MHIEALRIGWWAAVTVVALVEPIHAGQFQPPKGCTAYLTVQARGCKVSHHYTCKGEAKGLQWRVDIGNDGPYFVSQIDAEGQWLDSMNLWDGVRQRLMPGAADPASLSALFATGTDAYDFRQISTQGTITQVKGFDTLTGKTVVIDGVTLEETAFEFRETDAKGLFLNAARGNEYVHRGWRLFFSGPSEWDGGGGFEPFDRSPARFDEPGDAGFLSDTPEFDCSAQLARFEVQP